MSVTPPLSNGQASCVLETISAVPENNGYINSDVAPIEVDASECTDGFQQIQGRMVASSVGHQLACYSSTLASEGKCFGPDAGDAGRTARDFILFFTVIPGGILLLFFGVISLFPCLLVCRRLCGIDCD